MKADIHPEYVVAHVTCSCGNEFTTRSTKAELTWRSAPPATRSTRASRSWSTPADGWSASSGGSKGRCDPRVAERGDPARGYGARMSVSYGGQAVLEGVMMRGPSCWAVAVRTPEGGIQEVVQDVNSPMKRHRIWRLPVIRGVIALGESLAIGFRALAISANVLRARRTRRGTSSPRSRAARSSSPSRSRSASR